MVNPFPSLLAFSFFGPTIVRVAAALIIIALAYKHFRSQHELHALLSPLLGKGAVKPLVWLFILIQLATGALLFIGLYTQIAAIVGIILALKSLIMRPRALAPFGHTTDWLLLAICCSLLLTGAGAFAFDVPL